MSSERNHFEKRASKQSHDLSLEILLQSALAVPEISSDFKNRLAEALAHRHKLLNSDTALRINGRDENSEYLSALRPIGMRQLRWIGAAAAAVLLLVVGIWSTRPVYGWATMLTALERCDWVQAITLTDSDSHNKSKPANPRAAAISWFSETHRVAAHELGDQRVFLDYQDLTIDNFDPTEQVVYQVKRYATGSPCAEFVTSLLAMDTSLNSISGMDSDYWEVLEENWRQTYDDGVDGHVELKVTIRSKSTNNIWHLKLLLEPRTHLPISCKVIAGLNPEEKFIEFTYPRHGPDSIFALGIPRETPFRTLQDTSIHGELMAMPVLVTEEIVNIGEEPAPSDRKVPEPDTPFGDAPPQQTASENAVADRDDDNNLEMHPDLLRPLDEHELVLRVNTTLAEFWNDQGILPAREASETEFLRRVYMDLTGRIPTVSEVYAFLDDIEDGRRERLVDELLTRRDHATHLAAVWRRILLPEGVDLNAYGGTGKFDAWLADRFSQNMPYNQIVSQLLLAEGRVAESGPLLFYAALKLNPEELAAKTSRVFLGTRMECAQCHDHPFDSRIAHKDFWGFAAYFAQISRPQGKMEMASPVLRIHDSNFGDVVLPDTDIVIPPKLPNSNNDPEPDQRMPSRRHRLVDWLTAEHNEQFAQATVNRLWQQLFGRGLVDPVDDMRPDNPSVCPPLLELLARDFVASGFDLRRLLRVLTLTDAYQLTSSGNTDDPSQALCFARMNLKSFTAEQLYDCIAVATRHEGIHEDSEISVLRSQTLSRQKFLEQFSAAADNRTDYQAGIPQALTLMHGSVVHGATHFKNSGLLRSPNAPFFTDEQRVDTLFLATLSRPPSSTERQQLIAYLADAKDQDRMGILGDILWALLNSAEFTFIH